MCGRFTYLTPDELADVVRAVAQRKTTRLEPDVDRPQARPGSEVHALVPDGGALAIKPLTWGFESTGGKLVFNTRIESALGGSPLWKDPVRDGRCIMPVASFFEPHASETARNPRSGRLVKRQYEFESPNGSPLLLAGVRGNDRLSIVTTEPNAWVSPVHARMPLVLRFEEIERWLAGDIAALADRSQLELSVQPEDRSPGTGANDAQLSLF